ncbi:hypothetical protein C8Q78DRAFT_1019601 [Trametes maxima]|nr:hypothetical protein C8Q78DRAFT_1019601 [Trametes maxima]
MQSSGSTSQNGTLRRRWCTTPHHLTLHRIRTTQNAPRSVPTIGVHPRSRPRIQRTKSTHHAGCTDDMIHPPGARPCQPPKSRSWRHASATPALDSDTWACRAATRELRVLVLVAIAVSGLYPARPHAHTRARLGGGGCGGVHRTGRPYRRRHRRAALSRLRLLYQLLSWESSWAVGGPGGAEGRSCFHLPSEFKLFTRLSSSRVPRRRDMPVHGSESIRVTRAATYPASVIDRTYRILRKLLSDLQWLLHM